MPERLDQLTAVAPEPTDAETERAARRAQRAFRLRTIRDGHVRIDGRHYQPEDRHMAYDGRLDGMRYAFGTYRHDPSLVCLWGTEAAYKETDEERQAELWESQPECVDGSFPWMWWREIKALRGEEESDRG